MVMPSFCAVAPTTSVPTSLPLRSILTILPSGALRIRMWL